MSKAIKIIIGILVVGVLIGVAIIYGCVSNKKAEEEKRKTVSTYEELVEADGYVTLDSDIDLNYQTIEPIKCETFDGQGYTIKNFVMVSSSYNHNVSFFDTTVKSIKNVNFEGASIKGEGAESLAIVQAIGENCVIDNVNVANSTISGSQISGASKPLCAGGIYAGNIDNKYSLNNRILNCTANNIKIEINSYESGSGLADDIYAGAIAATVNDISHCAVKDCSIKATSKGPYIYAYVGGIVGYTTGEITESYVQRSEITVNATYYENHLLAYYHTAYVYVGGVAGFCKSKNVMHCYSTENIINGSCAGAFYAGGLIGYAQELNVAQCNATENKIGFDGFLKTNNEAYLRSYGGLVGYADGSTISSSYSANNTLKENSQDISKNAGDFKASGLCLANSNSSISYCGTFNNILNANGVDELCTTKLDGLYSCIITSTKYGNTNNCEVVAEDFWITTDSLRNKLLLDGSWKFSATELPYLELDIANN